MAAPEITTAIAQEVCSWEIANSSHSSDAKAKGTIVLSIDNARVLGFSEAEITITFAEFAQRCCPKDYDSVIASFEYLHNANRVERKFCTTWHLPEGTRRTLMCSGTGASGYFVLWPESGRWDDYLPMEGQTHYQYLSLGNDGFWDWHIAEDYQYMSPKFWETLGYNPEEKAHHPKAWQGIVDEEDLAFSLDSLKQHFLTHGEFPYAQKMRFTHKHGHIVTLLCRGRVVAWDNNDNPLRMLGTYTDVSRFLADTDTANEQVSALQTALTSARSGIWEWHAGEQTPTIQLSAEASRILGISHYERTLPVTAFKEMIDTRHRHRFDTHLDAQRHTAGHFDLTFIFRPQNNDSRWISMTGGSDQIENAPVTRVIGTIRDISAEAARLRELEEALAFKTKLFEESTDLIFVKDREHRIVAANTAFFNVYPSERKPHILGQTTFDQYPNEQAEGFRNDDERAFKQGSLEIEELVNLPNGQCRTFLTRKRRFSGNSGEPLLLCVSRDITSIKNTESALEHANEELEEFAYHTSHDLRTPLLSTGKLLQIIVESLDDGDTTKAKRLLGVAVDSLSHLSNVVADMLAFAHKAEQHGESELIELHNIVDDCLSQLRSVDGLANTEITYHLAIAQSFYGNKTLIQTALENLLSNAIKYRDKTEERSYVILNASLQGDMLVCVVEDNGLGLSRDAQKKLFQMFKRFHPEASEGSGLGLYMLKKNLKKIGGDVEYTALKKGSRFTVSIPVEPS